MKRAGLVVALCCSSAALAARSFAVTETAATVSEDGVSLESWVDLGHPSLTPHTHSIIWWLGGHVGVTRNFEVGAFVLFQGVGHDVDSVDPARKQVVATPTSAFVQAIAEAKYSFVPAYEEGFHPFVRLQLIVWPQDYPPFQARLAAGADRSFGKLLVAANASYWDSNSFLRDDEAGSPVAHRWPWLEGELAASYAVISEEGVPPALAIGGEVWAIGELDAGRVTTNTGATRPANFVVLPWELGGGVFGGPTVTANKGRLSATAHVSFLLHGFDKQDMLVSMARLVIGISL